jgi:signal transduction histidine kinase
MDLVAFTRQVVDDFALSLAKKDGKHALELMLLDEPLIVKVDPDRLEAVLVNLLTNAVKYSPAGGTVTVRMARHGSDAVLEVEDQGIGIPAESQAMLFVPFYRASNVNARISGFGIGLYVVREIVERHGGRVEVISTENEGSTFRVVLPLLDTAR